MRDDWRPWWRGVLWRELVIAALIAAFVSVAAWRHIKHQTVEVTTSEMCVNGWMGYRSCIPRDAGEAAMTCALVAPFLGDRHCLAAAPGGGPNK